MPNSEYLYAVKFPTIESLARAIDSSIFDLVIFSWRQALRDLLSSKKTSRVLADLSNRQRICVLVPDHVGGDTRSIQNDWPLFRAADVVLVTNNSLRQIYRHALSDSKPVILFPDSIVDVIRPTTIHKNENQVIWVGNSKWGERLGFSDHKGYKTVLLPLMRMCADSQCGHKFIIIDSAVQRIPHSEVMRFINESQYLLQTSASEGTGMPVLEALSCGTVPISTPVGAASELLVNELSYLLSERNPESFFKILHDSRIRSMVNSNKLFAAYNTREKLLFDSLIEDIISFDKARFIEQNRTVSRRFRWEYFARFLYHYFK